MKRCDLTGQTFNYLTVIELSEKREQSKARLWKCQCRCGNITYTSSNKLLTGMKKSCGCENPYAQKRKSKPEYKPLTDCKSYRPDRACGCDALNERLCETRGKCSFYKQKSVIEL